MKIVMMPDSAVSPLRGVKNEGKKKKKKDDAEEIPQIVIYKVYNNMQNITDRKRQNHHKLLNVNRKETEPELK